MKMNEFLIMEITERLLKVLRARDSVDPSSRVSGFDVVKIENASRENLSKLLASSVTAKDRKAKVIVVIPRRRIFLFRPAPRKN
ncbi:MAG: hypothetical protein NT079_04440 [Candidatus Omnitrophica bacterium]|nr:hypothetical protein [Candidatus Omnitrophota bacterium]